MSDDFIPLNQSTPVQQKWQPGRNQHQRYNSNIHNNRSHNGKKRGGHNNKWSNSSRSSFESNSSNNSYGQESNIDAYLHPSMLQDPWKSLRQRNQFNTST